MMTYRPQDYAALLLDMLHERPEQQSNSIQKFVALLARHHALTHRKAIIYYFAELYNKKYNVRTAVITTATDILPEQKQKLEQALDATRYTIEYVTDPTLLGGMRILIDNSILIDGSIKKRIATMFAPLS